MDNEEMEELFDKSRRYFRSLTYRYRVWRCNWKSSNKFGFSLTYSYLSPLVKIGCISEKSK